MLYDAVNMENKEAIKQIKRAQRETPIGDLAAERRQSQKAIDDLAMEKGHGEQRLADNAIL